MSRINPEFQTETRAMADSKRNLSIHIWNILVATEETDTPVDLVGTPVGLAKSLVPSDQSKAMSFILLALLLSHAAPIFDAEESFEPFRQQVHSN